MAKTHKASRPFEVRFWEKVEVRSIFLCWPWLAHTNKHFGYGRIAHNGRVREAHTVAWELFNGKSLPKGLVIMHNCDNPKCVNPHHLFLGTQKDNLKDMKRKKRHAFGIKNGMAKLQEEDVKKILIMGKEKTMAYSEIGQKFNVSQTLISNIIRGKLWKNILDGTNAK